MEGLAYGLRDVPAKPSQTPASCRDWAPSSHAPMLRRRHLCAERVAQFVKGERACPSLDERILETLAHVRWVEHVPRLGMAEHEIVVFLEVATLAQRRQLTARAPAIGTERPS